MSVIVAYKKVKVRKMHFTKTVRFFLVSILLFLSTPLWSQDEEKKSGSPVDQYSFSLTGASLLPYGIVGVRSSYSGGSFRFGIPVGIMTIDFSYHTFRGEGVTYHMGAISAGNYMTFFDLMLNYYVGPTLSYYQGKIIGASEPLAYTTVTGFHMGIAPMYKVAEMAFIRADFQLTFGPGMTLYPGLGFSLLF